MTLKLTKSQAIFLQAANVRFGANPRRRAKMADKLMNDGLIFYACGSFYTTEAGRKVCEGLKK